MLLWQLWTALHSAVIYHFKEAVFLSDSFRNWTWCEWLHQQIILLFTACCRCMYKQGMLFEMYVTLFYNYKKNYISFEIFFLVRRDWWKLSTRSQRMKKRYGLQSISIVSIHSTALEIIELNLNTVSSYVNVGHYVMSINYYVSFVLVFFSVVSRYASSKTRLRHWNSVASLCIYVRLYFLTTE